MYRKYQKRIIAIIMITVLFIAMSGSDGGEKVYAAGSTKKFSLKQAQQLAIANSSAYKKVLNKIELQEIKYAAAVKSIKMKKKNMSTFRWTPLLSFKFPEQPTLADEYDWQYKPVQITCVINKLKHQLNDEKLASKEEISLLYVEAYVCQEKIAFQEKQLEEAETTLEKNKIRLSAGEASQTDIDKMQQKIDNLTTQISLQKRTFENKKSKISKLVGMDITTGYTFLDPYLQAEIPRSALAQLENYTLENDQSYYETKLDTEISLTSLDLTNSLMSSQYGGKMKMINSYITQAKNGEDVDTTAFKAAYNSFLDEIDRPWNGTKKILFIKINKEWFKGAVDGSRYVEDDPYQLYTEALEYADAVKEQQSAKEELTASVDDGFETLVTAKNSYETAKKEADSLKVDVDKALQLNMLGEMEYEELSDLQAEYDEQQLSSLDLLAEYTKQLYSYDRLTCGGITSYLEGTDLTITAASGGNSYIQEELEGQVTYYIDYKIEDNIFIFGICVPENYSLNISHYELYVNDKKTGEKTEADQTIEHLALDLDHVDSSKVYLYDGDTLVAACDFDSTVNQDALEISGGYQLAESSSTDREVASYQYSTDSATGLTTLKISKKDTEDISYYQVVDQNGKVLGESKLIPVSEEFSYLSVLSGDFSEVKVKFYDSSKKELYTGTFMTDNLTIVVTE